MEERKWLYEELETPYIVSQHNEIEQKYQSLKATQEIIDNFCSQYPEAKEMLDNIKKDFSIYSESFNLGSLESSIQNLSNKLSLLDAEKTEAQLEKEKTTLNEVLKLIEAYNLVSDFSKNPFCQLDERVLIRVHSRMYENNQEAINIVKHRFRNGSDDVIIEGQGYFNPLEGDKVTQRMNILFYNLENGWSNFNIIERSAMFVSEFIRIQPFLDGNKRTALMGLNFILERAGLLRVTIDADNSKIFLKALREAILNRDVSELADLFANIISRRQYHTIEKLNAFYLKTALSEKIETSTTDIETIEEQEDSFNV